MKINDLSGAGCFIGEDNLVRKAKLDRNEKVQLDGFLRLHSLFSPDKEETAGTVPGFGFPCFLEERGIAIAGGPTSPRFDLAFEFHEPFEGYGDGELNGAVDEHGDDFFAEEGGVHAYFNNDAGERNADFVNARCDKGQSIMGVVDVAGTMEQIENLSCLSDGAKKRVVATPSFVFFIVADGGVLRMPFGGDDGTVEVQRNTCYVAGTQPQDDQFTAKAPDVVHTTLVGGSEDAADGRDIGEHIQPEYTLDKRIVFIKTDVAQTSIACQYMDDKQKRDASVGKNGRTMQMFKAGFQTRQELNVLEELPKENQSGEGREALLFEGESGDRAIVPEDKLRTVFHAGRFPFLSLSWLTLDNIREMEPSCFII